MYTDPPRPAVPGQGLAVLVRDDVPSYVINVNTTLATIVIRVKLQHEYTICNLYVPPNENIGQNRFHNLLNQLPDPYLIVGDPNARSYTWGDYNCNNNGRIIDNILLTEDIYLLNNGGKTHFDIHRGTETCPDISLYSPRIAVDLTWETIHEAFGSDHFPILIKEIGQQMNSKEPRYNLHKADWRHTQYG